MSDIGLAIMAASLSTLGSLLLQTYVARTSRRIAYNDKRLAALLDVRQAVEIACGRWYSWAATSLNGDTSLTPDDVYLRAGEATHDGWYSTRVFEMYFPSLSEYAEDMRKEIQRYKDEAHAQVSRKGTFDPTQFSANKLIDLDDIARHGRKLLGFPDR